MYVQTPDILIEFDGFDWDGGNKGHCRKHGLTLAEIEAALSGEVLVAPDVSHSDEEDRFLAIGRDASGRPFFIVYTYRTIAERQLIRPVSARHKHKEEIERYET